MLPKFQFQKPWLWRIISTPRNKYLVYMFLNVPKHWLGIAYQIFMWMLITTCILVTMFMQISVGSVTMYVVLFWLDLSCLIIFTCEFVLNVWASTVLPKYSGPYGVYLILINPLYILDMAVIGLTIADVALDCVWLPLASGLRGFRIIHFFQYRYTMVRLLWKAIWSERFQLLVTCYYCLVWIFTFGFLMYFIEQPFNDYFNTVANSVWWAVVTFTTVGYGNAAPITIAGKIVTAFAMITGVWLFGLPAGVVGAALAMKCEDECSSAGTLRRNFGAAMVQNAWKVYRIRKEEDRQQEGDPPLRVRLRSHDGSLQFLNSPNAPPVDNREYFNPIAVKFVFLLKHAYYKRKFVLAEEINDSKNFYETYMQTSWQQTNMLLNLHNKVDHLWDSVSKARERLDHLETQPGLGRSTRSADGDQDDTGEGGGDDGGDGDDNPPPPPLPPAPEDEPSSNAPSECGAKCKHESPLVMLRRHNIPLHRILRRQIVCWNCLYRKEKHKRPKRSVSNESVDELPASPSPSSTHTPSPPPLLLDLSTPRPSMASAAPSVGSAILSVGSASSGSRSRSSRRTQPTPRASQQDLLL